MAFTTAVNWLMVIALAAHIVLGQENAQTRIPNSLVECYDPVIYQRDNRLPATINTLIELIRKVEYSNDYNRDIKEIAVSLLHRFRMDGIEHATGNFRSNVLPFGPSGYQFSKHRLLLSRLIPGNVNSFPNNTLSTVERVSAPYFKCISNHIALLFSPIFCSAHCIFCYRARLKHKSEAMNQLDADNWHNFERLVCFMQMNLDEKSATRI